MQKKLGKRDGLKPRVSNTPKHQPEEALTNDASEFPETDMADPDIPETDAALDSDLRGFYAYQSISLAMDKHCNDSDSDSSQGSDDGGLDSFEEITKQSDLKVYSIFLEKAQYFANTSQKQAYTGHSQAT